MIFLFYNFYLKETLTSLKKYDLFQFFLKVFSFSFDYENDYKQLKILFSFLLSHTNTIFSNKKYSKLKFYKNDKKA